MTLVSPLKEDRKPVSVDEKVIDRDLIAFWEYVKIKYSKINVYGQTITLTGLFTGEIPPFYRYWLSPRCPTFEGIKLFLPDKLASFGFDLAIEPLPEATTCRLKLERLLGVNDYAKRLQFDASHYIDRETLLQELRIFLIKYNLAPANFVSKAYIDFLVANTGSFPLDYEKLMMKKVEL